MKRHLAIFLPSLTGGGAERVMLTLAERFVARGIRCDLIIAMRKGELLDQVPPGVRLISLGKRKTSYSVFALVRYLYRERPQTLLSTIFVANITALIATTLFAKASRIILREANQTECDILARSAVQTILNKLAFKLFYSRADAVIAVSESVKKGLLDARIFDVDSVHVIHNPVRQAIRIPKDIIGWRDEMLVLACGRLELQKDHATLLRAFSMVRVQNPGVRLVILGEGSLLRTLQEQARSLGIAASVVFVGFDSNPLQWMQRAAVVVLSSRYEGMSNVLIEALASGCPIVATDCPGGTREVLADGKYGTLVPVGDDQALADAILRVLKGEIYFPDATEHLRQFDMDVVADAYLEVLFPAAEAGS